MLERVEIRHIYGDVYQIVREVVERFVLFAYAHSLVEAECMYVCMYVCMYAGSREPFLVCVCAQLSVCMHVCMYVCMQVVESLVLFEYAHSLVEA